MSAAELNAMLAKAREKLKAARIDFDHQLYDDAASRAYYAVFHAVSAALFQKSLTFSSHGQTIGAFNREFIKTGVFPADFNEKIYELFGNRQTADYDFNLSIDSETAQQDIMNANIMVDAIEDYLKKTGAL